MEGLEFSYIKQVSQSDIPKVSEFCMSIVREVFPMLDPLIPPRDLQQFEETYIWPREAAFLAAYAKNGEVVGTTAFRPYDGRIRGLKNSYELASTAEVVRCFVSKEFRRSGLGTKLVGEMVHFSMKAGDKTLYLHTHEFLPGAVEFWQGQGFVIRWQEQDPVWRTVHMDRSLTRKA
jgi:GNAT superfamily N-acetyltransferase